MRGIFYYTIGIGFVVGVLFRSLFNIGFEEMLLVLLLAFALSVVWRRKTRSFSSPLFVTALFMLSVSLGLFRMETEVSKTSVMKQYVGQEFSFKGVMSREPEARAASIHLHLSPLVEGEQLDERVLVTVDSFLYKDTFQYGDVVNVEGELLLPEEFETDTGRVFDYSGYLRAQKVRTIIYDAQVTLEHEGKNTVLRSVYTWKSKFMKSLEIILPSPHSGLGEGILLGVKRALGEDLEEAFRKTGIIHIVVLSGYNILIVVSAMMYILAYFCRPRMRMLLGLLWVVSFMFLVGLSSTVVRASIMAGLLLIARGTGRNYAVLRALMLAGVVMLLLNPYLLVYDIGFQLSFMATLGLILFSGYIEKRLTFMPDIIGLRGITTATIATQIVVLPLLLYHTGMLSLVSLVVNILVLPMVPLAMLLTFLTGVAGIVFVPLGNILGFLAYGSLNYIIKVAEFFGNLSLSAKTIDAFPFWIVVVAYILIAFWYILKVREDGNESEEVEVENSYEDWVIEEEKSPESRSDSGDRVPFR